MPSLFDERFEIILPFAIASSISLLTLLVTYVVLLAGRSDVTMAEKVGVPLGIVFTNGVILPLVWWLYVWRGSNLSDLSRSGASR